MENLTEREAQFLAAVKTELANEVKSLKEQGLTMEKIQEAIDLKHQEATKGLATETALKALEDTIATMSMEVKGLKEKAPEKANKSIFEQLVEQTKGKTKQELLQGIELVIDLKQVGAIAYPSNAYVGMPTMDTSGWGKVPVNTPIIRTLADVATISTSRAVWVEMGAREGAPTAVSPAGTKPLIDFTPVVATQAAVKYAAIVKFPEELLDDMYDFMREMEMEILNQVAKIEDSAFITYLGTKGVAYDLSTITTTSPTSYEALLAAVAQVRSSNFEPTAILVNPADFTGIEIAAFKNGYAVNGFINSAGPQVGGVPVVQSNQVTAGDVFVGDFKKLHIRNFKNLIVKLGMEGTDFKDNMITAVGETRNVCYVKGGEERAFVYDTIADIVAAITAGT